MGEGGSRGVEPVVEVRGVTLDEGAQGEGGRVRRAPWTGVVIEVRGATWTGLVKTD